MSQQKLDSNHNILKPFNLAVIFLIVFTFLAFNFEFRTSLLMGFILATLTYPISNYLTKIFGKKIDEKKAKNIAAIVTIFFVTLITLTLLNLITSKIVSEIPKFAEKVYGTVKDLPHNQGFLDKVGNYGVSKEIVENAVAEFDKSLSPVIGGQGGGNIKDLLNEQNLNRVVNVGQQLLNLIFNQIVYLILFFLAWFNALVFGSKWLGAIFTLTPFDNSEKKQVSRDLEIGVRNVIYANLLSGIIHTLASFLIMLVFGVDNIFIISLIVFFIGFLPASPSELGYAIPLTIIFAKNPAAAIVLAIFAELLIIWVNYVFLPKIILSGNDGNPLFVVTSVLAGIGFFGIMGFIIGPVIMIFINTLGQILLRRASSQRITQEISDLESPKVKTT